MTVEDIEEAILRLTPQELARLRAWFAAFETGMAAPKAEQEGKAAKIGRLAGRAVADFRKRLREP
jgi:hypothetical protein